MNLVKLEIERIRYGDDKGQFKGAISFDNKLGQVSLTLSKEQCDNLFRVCADGIVETAKAAATELTFTVIEHQKAID